MCNVCSAKPYQFIPVTRCYCRLGASAHPARWSGERGHWKETSPSELQRYRGPAGWHSQWWTIMGCT